MTDWQNISHEKNPPKKQTTKNKNSSCNKLGFLPPFSVTPQYIFMHECHSAEWSRRFTTQGHQRHSKGRMDIGISTFSKDFLQWHTSVGINPSGRRTHRCFYSASGLLRARANSFIVFLSKQIRLRQTDSQEAKLIAGTLHLVSLQFRKL